MKQYNKKIIRYAKVSRKNQTPWERVLWYEFLRNYPIKFQRQKVIGNYIADFYCAKAHLVIELDGGMHNIPKNQRYDSNRTNFLEKMNLQVLRISNSSIDEDFYSVCTLIDITVKKNMRNYPSGSDAASSPHKGRR